MDFDIKFRRMPEKDRAEIIKEIGAVIDGLNLVNYPTIRANIERGEGRVALLHRIVKESFANKNISFAQIIDMIENTTD